jgi:farnesyl-diphosphate farnesyltransferase
MRSQVTADKPCLPPYAGDQQRDLTRILLRDVSRSFYLTLRVLPREIRPQISLAYLLARASDTIADTKVVPRAKRVALLRQMQTVSRVPELGALAEHQSLPAEGRLLEQLGDCFDALNQFDEADCRLIQELLQIIIGGQIFDLERFPEGQLTALTDDELDRYTYLVAGCVGEFWTKMCVAHLPGMENLNIADGVRFGKGLQLVNVLRDVGEDRRRWRQYLPNLDDYQCWLDRAVEHLDVGWKYTLAIPSSQWRLRLACIWPIWIGLKTIARLRAANPLDPNQRAKISRGEVYGIMLRSLCAVRRDGALDAEFARLREAASRR